MGLYRLEEQAVDRLGRDKAVRLKYDKLWAISSNEISLTAPLDVFDVHAYRIVEHSRHSDTIIYQ